MINIKTDTALKQDAQRVANEMGLPLNVVINNYLAHFVKSRFVNFSAPLTPNKKTAKTLDKIIKDTEEGKNLSPAFSNSKDAINWLQS